MFFAATRRRRQGALFRERPLQPRAAGGDPPVPPALILCHLHCVAETTSCRYSDAPPTSCRREGSALIRTACGRMYFMCRITILLHFWTACGRKQMVFAATRRRRLGGVPPRTPPNNPRASGGSAPRPLAYFLCIPIASLKRRPVVTATRPPTSCRRENS